MNFRQNFIFVIFFIYKTSESLFQPAIRLYIYETVINIINKVNGTRISYSNVDLQEFRYVDPNEYENNIQREAAQYILAYRILINLPAAFLTMFWGGWSDKFGRKLPLILPCIGAIASACVLSLSLEANVKGTILAIAVIMLAVLLYGLFGKSALITMCCNSYVVDVTPSHDRTKLLSRLLGMNFFGIFLGSFMVGITGKYGSMFTVLLIITLTNAVLVILCAFVIPESVQVDNNVQPIEGTSTDDLLVNDSEKICLVDVPKDTRSYNNAWTDRKRERKGNNRKYLIWLFIAIFWNQTAKAGEQDVILLYVKHTPMNWSDDLYGYYLALYYGCMGINLVFVLPLVERFFQPRDTILIMIGILLKSIRLVMMGSTTSTLQLFLSAVLGSFAGVIVAVIKSIMSKLCEEDEIGATFAIISAMEAVSSLVGPTIFNLIYAATLEINTGTIFYIDACLQLCFLIGFIKLHFSLQEN